MTHRAQTVLIDLEPREATPALSRLLAQTRATTDELRAELDRERVRLDDFACRAGIRPDLVRRFVAVGLLADDQGPSPAVRADRRSPSDRVTVDLLLDVLQRLEELRSSMTPQSSAPTLVKGRSWT